MGENNLQKKVEFDEKDIELLRDILKYIKVLEQQAEKLAIKNSKCYECYKTAKI